MTPTIFKTPVLNTCLCYLAQLILRCAGWRVAGDAPSTSHYVVIGAPHTSNWDFVLMMLVAFIKGLDVHWMGKDSLFPWPIKGFVRWLGGISIDRSKANNTVDQVIEYFNDNPNLAVIIPPEGTRSKADRWKTGFYHIAHGAQVPIVLAYIDAATKTVGIGPEYQTSGDIEKDLPEIQAFYKDKQGLKSELF